MEADDNISCRQRWSLCSRSGTRKMDLDPEGSVRLQSVNPRARALSVSDKKERKKKSSLWDAATPSFHLFRRPHRARNLLYIYTHHTYRTSIYTERRDVYTRSSNSGVSSSYAAAAINYYFPVRTAAAAEPGPRFTRETISGGCNGGVAAVSLPNTHAQTYMYKRNRNIKNRFVTFYSTGFFLFVFFSSVPSILSARRPQRSVQSRGGRSRIHDGRTVSDARRCRSQTPGRPGLSQRISSLPGPVLRSFVVYQYRV